RTFALVLTLGPAAGCGTHGMVSVIAGEARDAGGDATASTVAQRDARGCAPGATAGGPYHAQLFSFDYAGDNSSVAGWTTYGHGPIVAVADDSAAGNASNPGSLKATLRWPNYGSSAQIEYSYPVYQDFSCYRSMHF